MKSGKTPEKLDGVTMQEVKEGLDRIDQEPYREILRIRNGMSATPYSGEEGFSEDDVAHAIYVVKTLGRKRLCFELDQLDAIATCLKQGEATIPQDAATIIALSRLQCDECLFEDTCDYLQTDEVMVE